MVYLRGSVFVKIKVRRSLIMNHKFAIPLYSNVEITMDFVLLRAVLWSVWHTVIAFQFKSLSTNLFLNQARKKVKFYKVLSKTCNEQFPDGKNMSSPNFLLKTKQEFDFFFLGTRDTWIHKTFSQVFCSKLSLFLKLHCMTAFSLIDKRREELTPDQHLSVMITIMTLSISSFQNGKTKKAEIWDWSLHLCVSTFGKFFSVSQIDLKREFKAYSIYSYSRIRSIMTVP